MEIKCPKCGCEDAYHNGVCYECPDCGYHGLTTMTNNMSPNRLKE